MSAAFRLPLDVFYEREARHPRQRFLVQPIGGGQVETLTWADVGHQARCAAHWLRARELPQGSHIALISKNCAHWIIADLAIWMAGHVSVPLYPNLTAESVAQVLDHSEAALAFIGKLDDWPGMSRGVREDCRRSVCRCIHRAPSISAGPICSAVRRSRTTPNLPPINLRPSFTPPAPPACPKA
jgi:long-subunit acyl-CoA synthetase (AMP-forming)